MFSIVIPVYNKAHCLAVTLNSVLNQTHTHYQVILVNDGSTDDSVAVIKSFNDPRITLINQPNGGVSSARNTGIKNAKGDWVAFLDADDWWHPSYLAQVHSVISQSTAANIVTSGFFCLADQSDWNPTPWPVKQTAVELIKNLPTRWMQGIPFFTSSICVNNRFLQQQHSWFAVGESVGEDLDLWFRLAEQAVIYHINSELVAYRTEQTSSLSQQNKIITQPFFITQMLKRLQARQISNALIKPTKQFIAQEKLTRARQLIMANQRLKALALTLNAYQAWSSKRWLMTLFMALFLSKHTVHNWHTQRTGRKELK